MAVMQNLRQLHPAVEFLAICFDPPDAARTHHIDAVDMTGRSGTIYSDDIPACTGYPSNRKSPMALRVLPSILVEILERLIGVKNVIKAVLRIDVLIISGGGQIDDFWGGPWRRPLELFLWSLASRILRRKVIVFGTGLDNLSTRLGLWLSVRAMSLAHYRVFRDRKTLTELQHAGLRRPSGVAPDPAFSLAIGGTTTRSNCTRTRTIVVVCPISASAWKKVPDQSYDSYRDSLLETCSDLLRFGAELHLSNSQTGMDVSAVEWLESQICKVRTDQAPRVYTRLTGTVDDYLSVASDANLVIASRLHGVILPIVAGTPVIAISYMRKVSLVMHEADMQDKCLELTSFTSRSLTELAIETLRKEHAVREHLKKINAQARSALSMEYRNIVNVATTPH